MDKVLSGEEARGDRARAIDVGSARPEFGVGTREAPQCSTVEALTVVGLQFAKCSFAEPHRLFEHRVEHRCKIAG